nr:hypothetical protein [Marinomonas algarum]
MIIGAVWYISLPASLSPTSSLGDGLNPPSFIVAGLFAGSALAYVFFIAWLLARMRGGSSLGGFFLVIGVWLFVVLPNYIFIGVHLNISESDTLYLVSYGGISTLVTAIILPIWPSSRLIFKT